MHKKLEKLLRAFIIFWGIYLLFESFLYLFNIRLTDTKNLWLPQAFIYSKFIENMLGSVFLFVSIVVFEVQRDLNKYKTFIILSGIWTVFHGGLLIYLSKEQNYFRIYEKQPSLYVWFPQYNQYLFLEGAVLIIYSLMVYLWIKK